MAEHLVFSNARLSTGVTRSEMSVSAPTRCDTKDSDAWSKLNQTPRNEEYSGRLWWGHTRLNRGGIKCNARLQGGYHGNLSSQPRLPQQAHFESHALVVLFVGGKLKIVHQRRKSRRKSFRRRETKKTARCDMQSHLQSASMASLFRKSWSLVTDEMSMGNWASERRQCS